MICATRLCLWIKSNMRNLLRSKRANPRSPWNAPDRWSAGGHVTACFVDITALCQRRDGSSSEAAKQERQARRPLGVGCLAEWTGLEPATPGVTGRYSNQLNYHSIRCSQRLLRIPHNARGTAARHVWWVLRGSNSRHSPCKGDALPTELSTLCAALEATHH